MHRQALRAPQQVEALRISRKSEH